MSITSIQRDMNNNVCFVRMISTDNLATIGSTDYIFNNQDAINLLNGGVWSWFMTDMLLVAASDGNALFQFTNDTFRTLIIYGEQGSGVINPGLANEIAFYPANGTNISGLTTLANAVLATNGSGVPAMTQIIPNAVQLNITAVGNVSVGTWLASTIDVAHGGTGATSFTPFTVICGGTTSTGPLQNVVSVGTVGQVFTSNGPGALPSFQTGIASGIIDTGNVNDLPFYSASPSGKTLSPIPGAINSVLVTGGTAIPTLSQTLPNAVQNNITRLGTIVSIGAPLGPTFGGTGLGTYVLGDTLYASAANVLSALPGNITIAKQYLSQTGTGAVSAAPVWATIAGGDITGAALTKTDDTNVTLTLGGSPTTALLRATSLTLGWTGQLSLSRGGTNASLTASNGGIVYSTATAMAILAGTATANQVLLSGANTTPAWSTATYPPTTTINQLLYSSAANTIVGLATVNSSVLTTSAGGVPTWSLLTGFANAPVNTNITSMTGLTGTLQAPTGITSNAGLNLLAFNYVASAVNYLRFSNNSTGMPPTIDPVGTDAAINLNLGTKNSAVQIFDTTTTAPAILKLLNTATTFGIGLRSPAAQASDVIFTLPGADATISGQALVSNASTILSFGGVVYNKNIIIGGDATINPWQRGTSFAAISAQTKFADMWTWTPSGSGVVTLSQAVDAPTVSQAGILATNCFSVATTTADAAIAAGDIYIAQNAIEGYNFAEIAQRTMTLSFWVKSTKTGIFCVSFTNSGADRSYVSEYTVNVTNTWELKTVTVTASPSAGTWNYTNGLGLSVNFAIAAGSTFQTTANTWQTGNFVATSNQVNGMDSNTNVFKLALVKLEQGSVATPWQLEDVATVFNKCQRYYRKSFPVGTSPAQNAGVAGAICTRNPIALGEPSVFVPFDPQMRITPIVTTYNPSATNANWRNVTAGADVTVTTDPASSLNTSGIFLTTNGTVTTLGNVLAIHYTAEAGL